MSITQHVFHAVFTGYLENKKYRNIFRKLIFGRCHYTLFTTSLILFLTHSEYLKVKHPSFKLGKQIYQQKTNAQADKEADVFLLKISFATFWSLLTESGLIRNSLFD